MISSIAAHPARRSSFLEVSMSTVPADTLTASQIALALLIKELNSGDEAAERAVDRLLKEPHVAPLISFDGVEAVFQSLSEPEVQNVMTAEAAHAMAGGTRGMSTACASASSWLRPRSATRSACSAPSSSTHHPTCAAPRRAVPLAKPGMLSQPYPEVIAAWQPAASTPPAQSLAAICGSSARD
jgi:hypothetical protein